jgi:hypothetical protein
VAKHLPPVQAILVTLRDGRTLAFVGPELPPVAEVVRIDPARIHGLDRRSGLALRDIVDAVEAALRETEVGNG